MKPRCAAIGSGSGGDQVPNQPDVPGVSDGPTVAGRRPTAHGESGCGKSTFVNLMMRFYDPDFGEILLDGVNIKDYNLHDLRKAVSLVM